MSEVLLTALQKKLEGDVAVAKANIDVYSKNSVGIGEHPDIVQAIEDQVAIAAEAQDKLNMIGTILQDELELLLD